ncbi:alanine aminotransferase 1-like [Polyodon spathula]|uniref:alanine aminotransferase 1-like n=1 Tax=Polyodon spathula TaxID=7913 RepID=UPI001B7D9568|nr:alanine aminotransferase 1-like [Polyodon spathula]
MTNLKKVLTLKEVSPMAHRLAALKTDLLITRAEQLRREIKQGVKKPFKEVIEVHSGDGQAMGMKAVTFIRQVMAACFYPELLHSDRLPSDVKSRAQEMLQQCGGSVGVYSDTSGLEYVQHNVARFIEERDEGVPCDPQNIFLTAGSQKAGQLLLNLLVHNSGCGSDPCGTGVLVPAPCSPWFSLALQEAGGVSLPYFLTDQGVCWELEVQELQRVIQSARGHCTPRVLFINNPGNPTGHVQSRQSIEEVIRFAASEGLYLLVDEVYQDSVFGLGRAFLSYKKVLYEMGPEFSSRVELAAIHSASKGVTGECGFRCGFIEFVNLDPQVKTLSSSYFSINSVPPMSGQLVLATALHPPKAGEPSYYTWTQVTVFLPSPLSPQESQSHLSSLSRNAALVVESLNRIPGIRVLSPQGGFFCFPRIHIPPLIVQEAETQGLSPDLFYCLRFLEEWGVAVGPGSDFGTREGSHHISCAKRVETGGKAKIEQPGNSRKITRPVRTRKSAAAAPRTPVRVSMYADWRPEAAIQSTTRKNDRKHGTKTCPGPGAP